MEETPRKRGRPKLFLTKEMVEERRLLKRLCKYSRRNLRDKDEKLRASDVAEADYTGEPPTREDTDATLDEIGGIGPLDENLGSSNAVERDPPASSASAADEALYPPDNSLKFSGVPNHEIQIKTYGIELNAIPTLAVSGILVYIGSFSIGIGADPWVIMSQAVVLGHFGEQSLPVVRSLLTEALRLDRMNYSAWYNLGLLYKDKGVAVALDAAECFQAAVLLEDTAAVEPFR